MADREKLEQRVDELESQVAEIMDVLTGEPENAHAVDVEAEYAPNETVNEIIRFVLDRCRARDSETATLQDFYRAAEYEGYTRTREKKKYSRMAVRYGPFVPHSSVTSAWVVDPAQSPELPTEAAEP